MMILATWNTLDEVAAYLLDRTGEPWTPRSITALQRRLKRMGFVGKNARS